ncbi:signal peptidase II [Massiliimalia timonensis]|uniref:signal peptidase II n=1 Tax=Massiliimalia timonensis TaxID=1987501 RepID=UPI000B8B5032|nr:signal peptidase II [Massiliimalia timonensis]
MNIIKKHLNYFVLFAALVAIGLDQLFKYLAIQFLSGIETLPLINGVLNLTYLENRGAAFGIFQGKKFLLVGITGLLILGLIVLLLAGRIRSAMLMWAVGLIIGGGIGNLIDRIFRGYVVDYVHVRFIQFPIFNFADCLVVIGTIMIIIYFLFIEGRKKTDEKTQETSK